MNIDANIEQFSPDLKEFESIVKCFRAGWLECNHVGVIDQKKLIETTKALTALNKIINFPHPSNGQQQWSTLGISEDFCLDKRYEYFCYLEEQLLKVEVTFKEQKLFEEQLNAVKEEKRQQVQKTNPKTRKNMLAKLLHILQDFKQDIQRSPFTGYLKQWVMYTLLIAGVGKLAWDYYKFVQDRSEYYVRGWMYHTSDVSYFHLIKGAAASSAALVGSRLMIGLRQVKSQNLGAYNRAFKQLQKPAEKMSQQNIEIKLENPSELESSIAAVEKELKKAEELQNYHKLLWEIDSRGNSKLSSRAYQEFIKGFMEELKQQAQFSSSSVPHL